ncbi:hypothetical protein AN643_03920 [Candidatus Epulonipiscioides saccharophilum]|nr:hypothetical protein AN643_03920 [Epulopiscium sp. SCG-B10WGA-EpuloB]
MAAIEIRNATKYYGKFKAIDNISMKVEKGTVHGLIGINGSGKTTLIKAIVGIHELSSGEIKVLGRDVFDDMVTKSEIGYVADRNRFFKYYKVKDLVKFYSEVYPKFSFDKFNEYNERMKILGARRINGLSKGMQMKLSIMLNLARNSEILILDEPTSGLDVIAKTEVLGFIMDEVRAREMTVLISSHHLDELEKVCDDMTMISEGKMSQQNKIDQIKQELDKLQVVFSHQVDINRVRSQVPAVDVQQNGNVYYIVTSDTPKTIEQIKKIGAFMIEKVPISVEEVFVYLNRV